MNLWKKGTARWADEIDLQQAGILNASTGLIIGKLGVTPTTLSRAIKTLLNIKVRSALACEQFAQAIWGFGKRVEGALVRLPNVVHSAVFAPTGVGKGVSIVIPHLLASRESAVVIDFKGENAQITADARREFGHKVVVLDPFKHTTQSPDTFNPLDFIDKNSPEALDDCRDLANALVITTGEERDPHFVESAKVWIASMIALVVFHGEVGNRSLQTVRSLLSDPKKMEGAIELMCSSTAASGMLSRMGHQLQHYRDKELSSTLTTTLRFLYFLDTPAVYENTRSSSFDPGELTKGKQTIYLVLPPEHMRAQAALLRMWIGAMIRAVVRNGLQEENKVYFILDEAASLGRLEPIDDAVDKFRGYGVRLIFLYQSLGQLSKCFPDGQEQTLLSNCTQVFFGVNDKDTCEYVSSRLGEATIILESGGSTAGWSHSTSGSQTTTGSSGSINRNWAQEARSLLKPEEVAALPPRIAITFTPGLPPLWSTLLRYYEHPKPAGLQKFLLKVKILVTATAMLALFGWLALTLTSTVIALRSPPNGSAHPQGK